MAQKVVMPQVPVQVSVKEVAPDLVQDEPPAKPEPFDPDGALTLVDLTNLHSMVGTIPASGAGLDLIARLRLKLSAAINAKRCGLLVSEELVRAVGAGEAITAVEGEAAALVAAALA